MNAKTIHPWLLALGVATTCQVMAVQSLETQYRRTGDVVLKPFNSSREVLQSSSAVIYREREELVYGVVLTADGWLATKASEIEGKTPLTVRIDTQSYSDVTVVKTDPLWDLALIKVNANGLVPVRWADTSALPQGTWVVANGVTSREQRRALVGILSANPREIPATKGLVLGVSFDAEEEKVLRIEEVIEKSGAAEAGLKKGDILLSVGSTRLTGAESLLEVLKEHKVGDHVDITYRRDGKEMKASVRLSTRDEISPGEMDRNDQMSGRFSKRRTGFPRVLQHDILADRNTVGGPLLILDGRCIGMNIARANRAESFAIPVEELRAWCEKTIAENRK